MAPMKVPIRPPEMICGQIWEMVFRSGRTSLIFSLEDSCFSSPLMMRSTPAMISDTANRPISTGMNCNPE